jgi:ubiquitin-protein ligase
MCLPMLKADEWKPSCKIAGVLESARQLLVEPNPDDAVEADVADVFKTDRKKWEKTVREYTKRYAS